MKRILIRTAALLFTLMVGVVYGISIQRHHVFPYRFIRTICAHHAGRTDRASWSIGIYAGSTPFTLAAPGDVANPVLRSEDVTDVKADFVADPFIIVGNGLYHMFFEVWNRKAGHGDIGYATSLDGKQWEYRQIVLSEDFHLSYPHVFEWNDEYYMVPESYEDSSVRLYRATSFPTEWTFVGNLLNGYRFVDPTIFRHGGRWWMFVTTAGWDVLNLYYADNLTGGWTPHPMNPVVKHNKHMARPAGRIVTSGGRVYRLTQDDAPSYGLQVFACEITEISDSSYAERLISDRPVVSKTGRGWNAAGMHHVDLHKIGNTWIAAVDGRDR